MSSTVPDPAAADRLGAGFSAGAADFAVWAPLLWEPMGRRAVAATGVRPGDRVLDACCGSGASAIPAAVAAGPGGRVDAVDLAPGLLETGRRTAARAGLDTVEFIEADVLWWPAAGYDVLLCCYGVFFFDDMDSATSTLVARVRPGGRVGILTWARTAMADFVPVLVDTIRPYHPGLPATIENPRAQRIDTPATLRPWLRQCGVADADVLEIPHEVALTPDLAWSLVIGTGFRRLLPPDTTAWPAVRAGLAGALTRAGLTRLRLDSLLATGRRAEPDPG